MLHVSCCMCHAIVPSSSPWGLSKAATVLPFMGLVYENAAVQLVQHYGCDGLQTHQTLHHLLLQGPHMSIGHAAVRCTVQCTCIGTN